MPGPVEWQTLAHADCAIIEFIARHPVTAEACLNILLYLLAFGSGFPAGQSFAMAVGHERSQHMEFTWIRLHGLDGCAPRLVLLASVLILSDSA